jgi:hypothetical protein
LTDPTALRERSRSDLISNRYHVLPGSVTHHLVLQDPFQTLQIKDCITGQLRHSWTSQSSIHHEQQQHQFTPDTAALPVINPSCCCCCSRRITVTFENKAHKMMDAATEKKVIVALADSVFMVPAGKVVKAGGNGQVSVKFVQSD